AINRHRWQESEILAKLADEKSHHNQVCHDIKNLIAIRKKQPAFHPNATQYTLQLGTHLFGFWRQSINREQSIFCIYNISDQQQVIALADLNLIETECWMNLLTNTPIDEQNLNIELSPYQVIWLSNR
ncbi:MAG: alpha-amylase, partial [Pseudoalteromonas sp.]